MKLSHYFVMLAVTITLVVPCVAQDATQSADAAPAVSGTGNAGRIAVWKNSTTLASSVMNQASGNIGVGTTTPAAKLEVNGDAQVDGNFSLSGSIMLTGVGQLLWAPNDTSGNFSAGLGALPSATTGAEDTAIGNSALSANTMGSYNTALGYEALSHNTTGCCNTASGDDALSYNTSGNENTANGMDALWFNTTGVANTAIGFQALELNITGGLNVAIGFQAGFNVTTTSNNIDIGNQGTATDSGTIRIGTPFVGGCSTCQTSAFIAGIYGSSTGLANVGVVIDANGNLGTVSSSRRYKEDIHDMADASSGLMRLRPITFRYKKAFDDGSKPLQYGLIAEEVADVYPDLVARSADGQIETVKYQLLDPMLLNELQKQHATITAQKEQIRSLEERLARVEAALNGATVTASTR